MLSDHNVKRAIHSSPRLIMNKTLNTIALNFATHLAKEDLYEHSNQKNLGENLAFMWPSDEPSINIDCRGFKL